MWSDIYRHTDRHSERFYEDVAILIQIVNYRNQNVLLLQKGTVTRIKNLLLHLFESVLFSLDSQNSMPLLFCYNDNSQILLMAYRV